MFRGAASLNLDAKGRLAVPSRYREVLLGQYAGHLVLTAHLHRCLLLYPQPVWEPIQSRIMALSSFDPQSSRLQRLLVGYAEDVALDSVGRLLVSPVLREFAGLEKQIMLVGQGSHFELWSMEGWRQQLERVTEADNSSLPPELEGFSL